MPAADHWTWRVYASSSIACQFRVGTPAAVAGLGVVLLLIGALFCWTLFC